MLRKQQYGVLICIRCHDYRREDVLLALVIVTLVPCHLLVAYLIEAAAARTCRGALMRAKQHDGGKNKVRDVRVPGWWLVGLAHTANASLCLLVSTHTIYHRIHHPGIGTVCQMLAIVTWLKNCSYALTNRDLRRAALRPSAAAAAAAVPPLYASSPYPTNITLGNMAYFWFAPTLLYQPVYPRSPRIRWSFVGKRAAEVCGLGAFIWLMSAQYASPVLRNSLDKIATRNVASIVERMMKLSTISLVIWLAGFFVLFESLLNLQAELTRFADRDFYGDWWNSASLGAYWRSWNKPVYQFMKRHVYVPMIARGHGPITGSAAVFLLSAALHELLVGAPTHNVIGVAFTGMMLQLPLVIATQPLERMQGRNGKVLGNCVFWVSFCLVGQPLGALLYFFAWQAKYGVGSNAGASSGTMV